MAKRKKSFKDYTQLSAISSSLILKNLPFVFFLGFLATIYIANAHYSEKKVREIQKLQSQLKELRWHYRSLKSEIMYSTRQSEVAKNVAPIGLKRKAKPKKIYIPERQ